MSDTTQLQNAILEQQITDKEDSIRALLEVAHELRTMQEVQEAAADQAAILLLEKSFNA